MDVSEQKDRSMTDSKKVKIFCHCHVYYPELWPELREALLNLPENCDLTVALTFTRELPLVREDCLHHFPKAVFYTLANIGYDIHPFFYVFDRIDPDAFDLVLKLHTKRDYPEFGMNINFNPVYGHRWRTMLLEFLSSEKNAFNALKQFEDESVGMVGNGRLWLDYEKRNLPWDRSYILDELSYLGMNTPRRDYLAGTMFMCRPQVLRIFHRKVDYARLSTDNDHTIKRVHCYEMLFGCALHESSLVFRDYAGRPLSRLSGNFFKRFQCRVLWKLYQLRSFLHKVGSGQCPPEQKGEK